MSSGDIHTDRSYGTFHKFYDSVFIVAKKEVFRVFVWLYQGGGQYVGDYLSTTPRGMRKLKSMEKEALRRKDPPVTFDIPFLYSLMQHTCDLELDTSTIWYRPSTPEERDSLEHTLYKLKELRNDVCHCPNKYFHLTQEQLNLKLNEVKELCSHMIRKAGEKDHRTPEVDTWVLRMEDDLTEIKRKPAPSGVDAKRFALLGKEEMKDRFSPSSARKSFVMPLIHSKGETGRHEMSLKLLPLWRCDDGSLPKVIVLQGDTGTGKTSICGYLHDSWFSDDEEINELQDFDIVFHVSCGEIYTRDLSEFLREFLADTMTLCNRQEIPMFLQSLRILWIMDGYEEATKTGHQLLMKILEQGTNSHLVFITTKPHHCQDLMQTLNIRESLCQVSLSGLSPDGIESFLMRTFEEENSDLGICQTKLRNFQSTVASLGDGPRSDISVPLKLILMLEVWKKGKLHKASTASLTHLYEAILDVQVEKLTIKIEKESKHKRLEIIRRIKEWLKILYEVAFQMTMNGKFVKIDSTNQMKLRSKAEPLNYEEDCLAIFLLPEIKRNQSEPTSYCFFHGSHQIYLSAQHILTLFKDGGNPESVLQWFSRNPMEHYLYPLLVQVLSAITKDLILERYVAGSLIELISRCSEYDAFQVVKNADYSRKVVEEVSKYIGGYWNINYLNIKAAHKLIEYYIPKEIRLMIFTSDTVEPDEYYKFLNSVSQKEVTIRLENLNLNQYMIDYNTAKITSGRCLAEILSPEAKCHLTTFYGLLNDGEIGFMERMISVTHLSLYVFSNDLLDNILDNLRYMSQLKFLDLRFEMPAIKTTRSANIPDGCKFHIDLIELDELSIRETGRSLSKINKSYIAISHDMSVTAASKLVEELERENIHVGEYLRTIHFGAGCVTISYGSLPLTQPMSQFKEKWEKTYVEDYEDDLGTRKQRLVTHGGISPKDVKYGYLTTDLRLRVQTF